MTYRLFTTIAFLSLYFTAAGQPAVVPEAPQHGSRIVPKSNALILNLGAGSLLAMPAVGGGLTYERFLPNSAGLLSATLQAAGYLGKTISLYKADDGSPTSTVFGIYAAPGLRYHPLRNSHRADLGLGISLPFGFGNRNDEAYLTNIGRRSVSTTGLFAACTGQFNARFQAPNAGVFNLYLTAGYIITAPGPANLPTRRAFKDHPLFLEAGLAFGVRW